jgi:nucleotide-binding universal stress UspA family protein
MRHNILFPTDFSPAAHHAFQYALQLAEKLDTALDLMSVYHLPVSDTSRVAPHQVDSLLREKRAVVMQHLGELAEEAPAKLIGQLRADYGLFVYQEIIDAARRGGHQLIVMGTKGERNPVQQMMGSVTTHTLMNAPCPVLAVPQSAPVRPISHIAYATDFEPRDEKAVANLTELAARLKAKVHFVHVDREADAAKTEAYKMVDQYPLPFSDFTVVAHPNPAEGINAFIAERDMDVLALFVPNRRLLERLFHRSFTKQMAFHTKVPLLVFRG